MTYSAQLQRHGNVSRKTPRKLINGESILRIYSATYLVISSSPFFSCSSFLFSQIDMQVLRVDSLFSFREVLLIDRQEWQVRILIELIARPIYARQVSSRHRDAANWLPPLFPYPFKRLEGREGDLPWWRLLLYEKVGFARETHCFYYFKRRIIASRATNVAKWRDKPLRYLLNDRLCWLSAIIRAGMNSRAFAVSHFTIRRFSLLYYRKVFSLMPDLCDFQVIPTFEYEISRILMVALIENRLVCVL